MRTLNIPWLLEQLTLDEKIALCSGQSFWEMQAVERLGIPSLFITDGPHGLRKQIGAELSLANTLPSTCFPTAATLASSWDRALLTEVGQAIGAEARAAQVSVVLGPGANIKRSPLGGRNFEYFSEDPYASSEMAHAIITGMQSQQVGASLKHFAANNQESRRLTIDTHVDERALREIYLASFEKPVKEAQPWTVMCAYNGLNGELCSQNSRLLTDVLRTEWGFAGVVVSDWGATYEREAALKAGMDLEMPGSNGAHDASVRQAIADGSLSMQTLDTSVTRILELINRSLPAYDDVVPYDAAQHHALARRAAAESIVLLKNTADILPLQPTQSVAVIGSFAKHPRYQGAGSSLINPSQLDTAYAAICDLVGQHTTVAYAAGYAPRGVDPDPQLQHEALAVAQSADVVLLFVGLPDIYETEGIDRAHMRMPDSHLALIDAITAVHQRVVVVLSNGAPIEMPWHNRVAAIVEGYLGGQAGGSAIVDVLYGHVNPSGKLSETFPIAWSDHPAHQYFPGSLHRVEYRESIYVGYRYYNTAQRPVQYPFGYGLSYTTFAYSNLRLSAAEIGEHDTVQVHCTVTNTGQRAGKEVVQLYVRDVESTVFRPVHELKGFAKVELAPGESCDVAFTLDRRAFAYYDVQTAAWQIESGCFEIQIGTSSRDIQLRDTVQIQSAHQPATVDCTTLAPYYDLQHGDFPQAAFTALLGDVRGIPVPMRGEYTLNTPLLDMRDSWVAQRIHRQVVAQASNMFRDADEVTVLLFRNMLNEMPLRTMLMFGGPNITMQTVKMILAACNGHWGKAVQMWWQNRKRA